MVDFSNITKNSIEEAIKEFDSLGEDSFYSLYGFFKEKKYSLLYNNKTYPSKAILGIAYGFENNTKPLSPNDFSGGMSGKNAAASVLERLGFEIIELDKPQKGASRGNLERNIFGEIPGVKVGQLFKDRKELSEHRVHTPTMAGISGSQDIGAYSIVLSGGYEDDIDELDYILYTGHGGQDNPGGKQVKDQEFLRGNKALTLNIQQNLPVRVIRGHQVEYGPQNGYRYDGLYYVKNYQKTKGKSGYYVFRFELVSSQAYENIVNTIENTFKDEYEVPERVSSTSDKIKRNQSIVKKVKELHNFTCQVCGEFFQGVGDPICIAAHIKPLGRMHNGPDVIENLLCLCPNHHDLFDRFGFFIDENLNIMQLNQELPKNPSKKLITNKKHIINPEFLNYHKTQYLIVN